MQLLFSSSDPIAENIIATEIPIDDSRNIEIWSITPKEVAQ